MLELKTHQRGGVFPLAPIHAIALVRGEALSLAPVAGSDKRRSQQFPTAAPPSRRLARVFPP